jgi:hypothetical protein
MHQLLQQSVIVHSEFMSNVRFPTLTWIISLNLINILNFVMKTGCVSFEARIEVLNIIQTSFGFQA